MEELIEQYLAGKLAGEDKRKFEARMGSDPAFKKQVEVQKELAEAVRIRGLKNEVVKAWTKVIQLRFAKGTLIAAIIITTTLLIISYLYKKGHNEENIGPTSSYQISTERDTVLESPGGIVVVIPSEAFETTNGEQVEDVEVEITEALDAKSIMMNGLSTMSDSNLLETAGMFRIVATSGGKVLRVVNGKELLVHIPSDNPDPRMMLFDGVEQNGQVNWVNPKSLKNYLVNMPFDQLDFYPPGYLDYLKKNGFNIADREWTDSLYYSFPCSADQNIPPQQQMLSVVNRLSTETKEKMDINTIIYNNEHYTGEETASDSSITTDQEKREICPASIKAIRQPEYANSFIATFEFQQRLKEIFRTCDEEYLEVYINYLDKDLSYSDSFCASHMSGAMKEKFLAFARQKLSNTADGADLNARALSAYFSRKRAIIDSVAQITLKKMYEERAGEDREMENLITERSVKRTGDWVANHKKEYEINLREAYRQAGLNPRVPTSGTPVGYTTPITTLGWKNLDRYVYESTSARETLSKRVNGKKVLIRYETFEVSVQDQQKYNWIECYLIPDSLQSYQKMDKAGKSFRFKLNELLQYSVVCLARDGRRVYFASSRIKDGQLHQTFTLEEKTNEELDAVLKPFNKSKAKWNLSSELDFIKYRIDYDQKLENRRAVDKMRKEIEGIIWPCISVDFGPAQKANYELQ